MVDGWKERPKCNVVEGCDKPSYMFYAGKFWCAEHMMKMYEKEQQAIVEKVRSCQ
jgi:hypothetical protein